MTGKSQTALACKFTLFVMLLSASLYASAADIVRVVVPTSGAGKSILYKHEVLLRALELSEPEFGAFVVEERRINMKPKRALTLVETGDIINVAIMAANDDWNERTAAVHIPIRGGTLSYRLLVVRQDDLGKFEQVRTASDLKKLTAGLQDDWLTTKSFSAAALTMNTSHNFEGLFSMLSSQRVDYVPRAVYEVYDELELRSSQFPHLVVEPTLLLHVPMVSYAYVTPTNKRLKDRLAVGLTRLADSGELKQIFTQYYADDFTRAALKNRTLIDISDGFFASPNEFQHHHVWQLHDTRTTNIANSF